MANEIHMFLAHFYADETPVETALTILDAQVPVCLLSFRRLRPLPCCQRSERLINFVQLDGLWNVADEDIFHPPDSVIYTKQECAQFRFCPIWKPCVRKS